MNTNKIKDSFCRSRPSERLGINSGGDPVVAVILLTALFWIMAASPAFAVWCYDPLLGATDEFSGDNCPSGSSPVSSPAGGQTDGDGPITTLGGLITHFNAILNTLVPFLVGLAVLVIMWGIFGYIRHSADEEKRGEARKYILWGVIFVFIMLSIWGFVNILVNTVPLQKKPPKVESVFPK